MNVNENDLLRAELASLRKRAQDMTHKLGELSGQNGMLTRLVSSLAFAAGGELVVTDEQLRAAVLGCAFRFELLPVDRGDGVVDLRVACQPTTEEDRARISAELAAMKPPDPERAKPGPRLVLP